MSKASESLLTYVDHRGDLHVASSDDLEHSDSTPHVIRIAAAMVKAGYKGVKLDEFKMANGRWLHVPNVCRSLPGGALLAELLEDHKLGKSLPSIADVMVKLEAQYGTHAIGGSNKISGAQSEVGK
jgi:hypothetical protein